MCEPLRGNGITDSIGGLEIDIIYYKASDVKSACEFYTKYKEDVLYLRDHKYNIFIEYMKWDYPDINYENKSKDKKWLEGFEYCINEKIWRYQDWLFDYCFGDVIE